MKLTVKDKAFLVQLKSFCESREIFITMKKDCMKRLVLEKNYGDKIDSAFKMTRQGVRWRFQRLFNDIYVSSYETIYWIESRFGTELRQQALEIAKDRIAQSKKGVKDYHFSDCRRQNK